MPPKNRNIGIIGKAVLTEEETTTIRFIGRCIARLGHRLILVPSKGTADVLREGMEVEGGDVVELVAGVIEQADHTLIYPDDRLLSRLLTKYPNLETQSNVAIITADQLTDWRDAVIAILNDRGINPPG